MRFSVRSPDDEIILRTARDGQRGWFLSALDGWDGTPAPREKAESAAGHDGDLWPSMLTQGSRTLTLSGFARCESAVEGVAAAARVNALFGRELLVVGEDAGGRRRVSGFLADDPRVRIAKRGSIVAFDLVICCPDPHRYGDPVTFEAAQGVCRVANEGTVGAWPVVEASGTLTYLTLALGDQRVEWSGTAELLLLDFADMEPSSGTVTYDDAFQVPPGSSDVAVSCNPGASVRLTVAPAWR